jgi:zinc/manganese transport system permease protein
VQQILFGSIFTTPAGTIPLAIALGAVALAALVIVGRPLLLTTVSPDIAAARGVPVRLVGLAYMLALAVSVGLSSLAIGAILSTALLIGPAATALRVTKRVTTALVVACVLGVAATFVGILLAYDSSYWGTSRERLPVSLSGSLALPRWLSCTGRSCWRLSLQRSPRPRASARTGSR